MQLTNPKIYPLTDTSIDTSIDRLLFILSAIAIVLLSPYFVWGNKLVIFRISHLIGNAILLYIILKHHNSDIYNIALVLFFLLISTYTMVGGTENHELTYIPLLALFFISLKPIEQLRVFNYFVVILVVIYSIGLVSYLLSVLGLNIQIGTVTAYNLSKSPYYVFFGHVEESGLPIYRFSSVFDEAGVVGTLSGLILTVIGISTRNIKSLIILLAGLVSFSLTFYIILILNLLFHLNIKKSILVVLLIATLIYASRNMFSELITNRLAIENGRLVGDNRTHQEFDSYYNLFIAKGGNDLIFGKGVGSTRTIEEVVGVASYKTVIINYGLIGAGLIICFYVLSVFHIFNLKNGWFICFIFIISAYQRPNLLEFYSITIFIGGLRYLKINSLLNKKLLP